LAGSFAGFSDFGADARTTRVELADVASLPAVTVLRSASRSTRLLQAEDNNSGRPFPELQGMIFGDADYLTCAETSFVISNIRGMQNHFGHALILPQQR